MPQKRVWVIILCLVVCSNALSTLSYTFPDLATDVYVEPGYSLGTLTAGFTLEVNLNIPGLTTPAVALDDLNI